MQKVIDHFINGKVIKLSSGNYYEHCNPATGEAITKVALGDSNTVELAVDAAKTAFKTWSTYSPVKRAKILLRFNQLLNERIDELAKIITEEHGKVLSDAKGSILRGIEVVEYCCGIPTLLQSKFSANVSTNLDVYSIRQPLGVCAGVGPFNFPIMVPIWMAIPSIACGNTFIIKPSEKVPSAIMYLASLLSEAGLPEGVFNVVNGHKEVVDGLLHHSDIKAVSAVGSTQIAEYIYKTATSNNKRSQTFGGAKNHSIVMPDVDLSTIAEIISGAAFGAAGERCMALSVAIVVGDNARHDQFITQLKNHAAKIKVGPGHDRSSDMGPLISKEHLNKILGYIESGISEGAELTLDGRDLKVPGYTNGFYLGPSIFTKVKTGMKIYQEEIFGPVIVVLHTKTYEEALELINNHMYANGTAIFTNDLNTARSFANDVQVGMVGINISIPVPFVTTSFGGWKSSAFGDLCMHGEQSVLFYTKNKSITIGPAKTTTQIADHTGLNMPVHN